jgi:hypothetical protein
MPVRGSIALAAGNRHPITVWIGYTAHQAAQAVLFLEANPVNYGSHSSAFLSYFLPG